MSDLPDDLEHDHISNYEISDDAAEAARQARRKMVNDLAAQRERVNRALRTNPGYIGTSQMLHEYMDALEAEVERLAARELNALRLLLMVQHGWPWPQVCDIGIDDARIMTRTNAPLPTEGDEV